MVQAISTQCDCKDECDEVLIGGVCVPLEGVPPLRPYFVSGSRMDVLLEAVDPNVVKCVDDEMEELRELSRSDVVAVVL